MERKVGEQFKDGDTLLEVVEASGCDECFYFHHKSMSCNRMMTIAGQCGAGMREFNQSVQFRIPKPNIDSILSRSYEATVKRGKITTETTTLDFVNKILEECEELSLSLLTPERIASVSKFDEKELADIVLTCFNMAKHYGIDLLKVMEKKTLYNEKRED